MSIDKSNSKLNTLTIFGSFFALCLATLSFYVTPYMLVASTTYFMMILGLVAIRSKLKTLHIRLMILAILIDVSLVLILEVQRGAIDTATSLTLSTFQMGHILTSTVATILYLPTFLFGYKRWKHPKTSKHLLKWHLRCGISAFIFRTLGFILMFSLLSHVRT